MNIEIKDWGLTDYLITWEAMKAFTQERQPETIDQLWIVEHPPVFTQGQAGKPEYIYDPGEIPVIQTDRGGQITYHGPGQLVVYTLVDLKKRHLGIRSYVCRLEEVLIQTLKAYSIAAERRPGAPGVYVGNQKIASLGLRVRNACTYHGIALNIDMDLQPFSRIQPCGLAGIGVTQMREFVPGIRVDEVRNVFINEFHLNFCHPTNSCPPSQA